LTTVLKNGPLTVAPYLRADFTTASLGGYAEQGASSLALTYGSLGFDSVAAVVGVRALYDIATGWGVLSPMARLEYRRELDGGFGQSMYYTDLGPAQTYVFNEADLSGNFVTAMLGVRARAGAALTGQVEYGVTAGSSSTLIQTLRATLRLAF